ncbi:hypothetical protein F4802DRAFT_594251 [Xylaria palmicola]|nr:hypothetical protein F4802DRAFT_594251 [Xylaria palmicola]
MPDAKVFARGKFLIPAQNSRHRTACLALYRALLRLAPRIVLPDDLAAGWGSGRNPVKMHVERAFRRNRADISPRLVYPALGAGYRMLAVLHGASTSSGAAHHASIVDFLRARLAERHRSLANRPPPPTGPKPGAPRPGTLPLLVDVTPAPTARNPDPQPLYATPHRPRPEHELGGTGKRKVPRFDMGGSDFPFMRLTKPQPALLSRILQQKITQRFERCLEVRELWQFSLPDAVLEDEWDAAVAELLYQQQQEASSSSSSSPPSSSAPAPRSTAWLAWQDEHDVGAGAGDDERSHAFTVVRHGIDPISIALTNQRRHQIARADAIRDLIKREKMLAAEEKARRDAARRERWEARMLEQHGESWRDLFPKPKPIETSEPLKAPEIFTIRRTQAGPRTR